MSIFSGRAFQALAVVSVILATSGCATVTRGTTQALTIETSPTGAVASLSNGERCDTPCTLTVKRKHPVTVELCKTGFDRVVTTVQSQISGAGAAGMAGNVILGGVIGAGVDAASGATKELRPNPLVVQLVQGDPGCETPALPTVPDGGQTPEEYQKSKKSKKSKE